MAEANVEKLGVLFQFVLADHVKDLDASGNGRTDEEFISLGRELNSLTSALGVEGEEQAW